MSEKRKIVVSHLVQTKERESLRFFQRFRNLRKVIRMIAWMKRWKNYKRTQTPKAELSIQEEEEAEKCLWRMIQEESFTESDKILTKKNARKDESGVWRIESKM